MRPPRIWEWVIRFTLGGLLVLILAVCSEATEFASGGKTQQRLTLDFHEIEITRALEIISRASGMNMVIGNDVRGHVTVYLKDVTWQQALDSILGVNGYGYVRQGNIIRIDKLDILRKERELRLQRGS